MHFVIVLRMVEVVVCHVELVVNFYISLMKKMRTWKLCVILKKERQSP